jgi:hypothetical protein
MSNTYGTRETGDPTAGLLGRGGFAGTGFSGKIITAVVAAFVVIIGGFTWANTTGDLGRLQTAAEGDYKGMFADTDACVKKVNVGGGVATQSSNAFKEALVAWQTNAPGAFDIQNKSSTTFGFPALVTTTLPDFRGSITELYTRVMQTMNDCTDKANNQQKKVNDSVRQFKDRRYTSMTGRLFGWGYPNKNLRVVAPGGRVIAVGEDALLRMEAQLGSGQTARSVETGINEGPDPFGGNQ